MMAEMIIVTVSSSSPLKGSLLSGGVWSVMVFLLLVGGFVVVVGIGVGDFAEAF
jgi:hypothetical protein